MARQGLNCTLSYTDSRNVNHVYRIRAGNLAHGVQMISAQSAARTQRAYYPHRTAMQQFTVQALLKDWNERRDFTNWLASYAEYALNPDTPQQFFPFMTVAIPLRNFLEYGVPLQGYQWGAHTGMMTFYTNLVFEAATSPGQGTRHPAISSVINAWTAFTSDVAIQYFYPFGIQLAGNQSGAFSQISYPGDPSQFQGPGPNPDNQVFPTPTGQPPPTPVGVLPPANAPQLGVVQPAISQAVNSAPGVQPTIGLL